MKKINTVLCSFGSSGKVFHAPFIEANAGYNLYGVWERSEKTAAEKYPAIKSFDTLEAMLADEGVELVVVNTPNYTHYEFAKLALLSGKNVLVEKSFTVTVSEAEELVELAKKQGKKLAVYQNRRYDSDFKTVKKIVHEGILGNLVEAEFHFDRYNLKLSAKEHKEMPYPGSGLLYDLGPHLIDQALDLFGMPHSLFGSQKKVRPLSQVNDYFDVTLFYPSLSVRLKSSLVVKEPLAAYSLHGTNGSFIKVRGDIQEDVLKEGGSPAIKGWGIESPELSGVLNIFSAGRTIRTLIQTLPGNYMEFYDRLYQSIVHGVKLPVSGEDGLDVMKVIAAVEASTRTGNVQTVL